MGDLSNKFYEVIKLVVKDDVSKLSSNLFSDEFLNMLDDEEKTLFQIFKNISSLSEKFEDGVAIYSPGLIIYGEGRTFDLTDMTELDYSQIYKMDLMKLPCLLRARISNVIWNKTKDISVAEISIKSYYELFKIFFDVDNWTCGMRFIKHAICFSNKINKKAIANSYLNELYNKVLFVDGKDKSLFTIDAIKFLIEYKIETEQLLFVLDNSISNKSDFPDRIVEAYNLKIQICNDLNKKREAKENRLLLAKYYVDASICDKKDVRSLFIAEENLKKAIQIYTNEGKNEEKDNAFRELLLIQKEISNNMSYIPVKSDLKEINASYLKSFCDLKFEEAVVRLIQSVPIITKDEIEKRILENATNPFACIFGMELKNSEGRTITNLPILDKFNPQNNIEDFNKHMYFEASLSEEAYGRILSWGIRYIKDSYTFKKEDLEFLTKKNPIIPVGRDKVILSAIYYGLSGELFEALHIFAPQMENIFRKIAEDAGSVMAKLKKDLSDEEKLMKDIFEDENLWDCYDNDILFTFKGLLNEKSGANIRNEIAHGIMNSSKGNGPIAVYFFCLVLKMLSFTATGYYEIVCDMNEKKKVSSQSKSL